MVLYMVLGSTLCLPKLPALSFEMVNFSFKRAKFSFKHGRLLMTFASNRLPDYPAPGNQFEAY